MYFADQTQTLGRRLIAQSGNRFEVRRLPEFMWTNGAQTKSRLSTTCDHPLKHGELQWLRNKCRKK